MKSHSDLQSEWLFVYRKTLMSYCANLCAFLGK